jgi:hypothetical protein
VRRRGSHTFQTIGSQMAVRLSALRVGRPLPPGRFLISFLLEADPRAIVRLEELCQLKNPITSSGFEHATFPLVATAIACPFYAFIVGLFDIIIINFPPSTKDFAC